MQALNVAIVDPPPQPPPKSPTTSTQTPNTYTLSPEEIAAYKRDGYLRLPGFLTQAEVAALETAFDTFMRGEVDAGGKMGKDFCDMSRACVSESRAGLFCVVLSGVAAGFIRMRVLMNGSLNDRSHK